MCIKKIFLTYFSLDGLTAVVEEVDFREHEDDFRQPGGHWGSSVCLDYIEVWTDKQKSKATQSRAKQTQLHPVATFLETIAITVPSVEMLRCKLATLGVRNLPNS